MPDVLGNWARLKTEFSHPIQRFLFNYSYAERSI